MQQPAQPFFPLEHVSHNCRSARFSHSRYSVRLFLTVTVLVCVVLTGPAAQSSSADAQTLLRKAQASLAAGNFAEAIQTFEQARRLAPDNVFEEIASHSGQVLSRRYVARGVATGDFFNSGQQDLLISVLDGSPVLLRNQSKTSGHWLRIKTVGTF